MTAVYVILLNWNRCEDTLECLASLVASTYHPLHLLVVDQHSSDGSPERIRAACPEVEVLKLAQNVGFAAGMNAGIRHALQKGATHLLLLNNDTVVAPEMIAELMAQLKPGVGMVGPVIFYYDRPETVWSMGGGIHSLLLEMSGNHGRGQAIPAQPVVQSFLSGCALLLPRETVERVGLWDERFFMYYEDLDYCLRVGKRGLRLLLTPTAHLWHKVSASSGGSASPQERYQMAKSSGLYFRKHMNLWRAPFILPFRFGSALLWSWRLSRQRRWNAMRAYWRGLRDGWLGEVLSSKSEVQGAE
ncbi:MAG: glycosyltransferase family 2 protein [Chloroflexi bacterium]|nr:glycosyltransferase family 2 protein [Chloroflexota bacterium]